MWLELQDGKGWLLGTDPKTGAWMVSKSTKKKKKKKKTTTTTTTTTTKKKAAPETAAAPEAEEVVVTASRDTKWKVVCPRISARVAAVLPGEKSGTVMKKGEIVDVCEVVTKKVGQGE